MQIEWLIEAAGLSAREQEAVTLFAAGTTTQAALGAAMGCAPATTGVFLRRARAKLDLARQAADEAEQQRRARELEMWHEARANQTPEAHHYCNRELAVFLIECVNGPSSHRDHGPQIGKVTRYQPLDKDGHNLGPLRLLADEAKVNAGCPVTAEDLMGPDYEVVSALELRLTQPWIQDRQPERRAA